jgi:hypothetical protein
LPSCHWLSEPCERSQCEAACGRMDNNLTLAALAELLLRYRPRLDGSLRPVPPNHFRCKPFHSIATEPLILSCRPSLECSCATFLSEPCERLVWHRDQVDRRPQFNEFRGGQMRPRPRAAKRPSVCSAWVSGQFPPAHRRFAPRTGLSSGRPLRGLRRSSHRSNTKTRPGAIEPRPSEPVRFVVYGHQRRSCHFPERALPSCHWLSEPCERSQCEAACGRMDNNLTLAAIAELPLRYRPRLDGSLRPVPPNHFRCKPFHSIATEPLILSCRPSLECSCATFLSEPCERLVWHRDQVDRRPQFNEFRGGQMRPRSRAAKRPSVCSAWVSGQFSPSTSSLRSSYWAFFGPPSSRATEVISP